MQLRVLDQGMAKQAAFSREEAIEPDWINEDDDGYWTQPFSVDQLDDF